MVIADLCKDTYRLCDLLHTHKIQFICTHCISQGFLVSSDHNFVGFRTDFKDECLPPKAIINFVRGWDYTMLQALHSAGLRVPEDVYLTGLDDDNTLPNFGYSMQYLPSMIDFSEAAAKLLIERITNLLSTGTVSVIKTLEEGTTNFIAFSKIENPFIGILAPSFHSTTGKRRYHS